ncbi:protein translocase subunit SecDF [Marivirga sp.]|uniref:protein translocase subunit SecDF n=1 Tax=Marivirga sp. TaxID=2018662 RepID=UPI002D80A94E|nr:protein translocase subunit SecDF [Marivirga sp.]HET8860883.1 protein translocase subunit SecDF [Marivirga sp.]
MKNKSFIIGITIIVSLLCIYFLSFTPISRKIEKAAEFQALEEGTLNEVKKQAYLDSIYSLPVFNLLGIEYTYQEIKQNELKLGLDLQGGMHITLQISPVEVLKQMASNSINPDFQAAISKANELQTKTNENFVDLFYQEYKKTNPEGKLSTIFANSRNQERINQKSSDKEILSIINEEVSLAIDRSFHILRTRLDRFGATQPNIQLIAGTERIQIELPGVENPERVRKLLQGVAKLEFWEVYTPLEINEFLEASNSLWLASHPINKENKSVENSTQSLKNLLGDEAIQQDSVATDTAEELALSPMIGKLRSPYGLVYELKDTALVNLQIRESITAGIFPKYCQFMWDLKTRTSAEDGLNYIELYALKGDRYGKASMAGEAVSDASPSVENDGPGVNMRMNIEGTKKWKKLTSENIDEQIAIVLDGKVYSAPVVQSEIPNGNSSISGNFSLEESKDLANILKAGKMPVSTQIVEEAVVGPSLGQEAIAQGLISMVAGLGLVIIFMVLYYGSSGMVANLALLINIFFIVGLLAQFGAALTLPGIAGIVLTIGMSVDANVLIFERIREELRLGKSIIEAIRIGYNKAYSSIIDSNVTTFLIGAILYTFGSGAVKGFALILMIGIACSLFTAVFITRLIVENVAKRNAGRNIKFDTIFSKNLLSNIQFDFIKFRKKAYLFSIVVILSGFAAIWYQGGLSLGVDFKGGRSYIVQFNDNITASEAREALLPHLEGATAEVKTYGSNNQLKITTSYMIDDNSNEADKKVESAVYMGLASFEQSNPEILSSSKIGATIADDIRESSQTSLIYSLLAIFVYIVIRFRKWQFGLGALVALFHDVLMVLSFFGLAKFFGFNLEIDQVFIAAILTVIGYSINDTVVVFDRLREFSGEKINQSLKNTFNRSINDTLSRTLITSFTVFIVVAVLLIFGGEVLRGFSFALLIGVIFGTYSSIFVAAPLVLDLDKEKNTDTLVIKMNKQSKAA